MKFFIVRPSWLLCFQYAPTDLIRCSSAVLFPEQECSMFTVEVLHNGFFCGLRHNLGYMCASTAHFNNCTVDIWSIFWVNKILRILGCERDGKVHVYWLQLGMDIKEGLVPVDSQSVIRQMINASWSEKTLHMFIDHNNFLNTLRSDVILRPTNARAPNPVGTAHAHTP
jgi:hypothetical protein